jgi:major membrane immunogen (membrane-anchored lipoprotein)
MKKTLLILVAIVFAVTACDKQTYVDGKYKVQFDEASHGYTAFMEVTVTADELTDVVYDAINDAGDLLKSEDTAYVNRMLNMGYTAGPDVFLPAIADRVLNATILPDVDTSTIDTYTGATGATTDAKILLIEAMENALAGEPTEEDIPLPAE